VRVTIDAGSRRDAELIAAALPGGAEVTSRRGYGFVRLRLRDRQQLQDLLAIIAECVKDHGLPWARLRCGDEEWMLRGARPRIS
jgi:hypothetical protein